MIVFPGLGKMFLALFTFDSARPPGSVHANLGDPGHRWLTAFGPYNGSEAVLDIEVTQGGVFDSATPATTRYGDGTLTVNMSDCRHGTITYDIDSANLQGEIPIQRLQMTTCHCASRSTGLAAGFREGSGFRQAHFAGCKSSSLG
jgi:hypothetical protein